MVRRNGGFIGTDGLDAPDPPTGVAGTAGNEQVSVAFTAPTDAGTSAITGFVAQVGGLGTAGTSSPLVVTGLTNGTAATAVVRAINAYGTSAPSDASASFTPVLFQRAVFIHSYGKNSMDFVDIGTLGNATDFGDLTETKNTGPGAASSTTKGIIVGGNGGAEGTYANRMESITLASAGNGSDFANLTAGVQELMTGSCGSTTRGIFQGGSTASGTVNINTITYVTIATTGSDSDFGDLNVGRQRGAQSSSSVRGLSLGGSKSGDNADDIEYITIASTGNATDFGNLTAATKACSSGGSNTRALNMGGRVGSSNVNTAEYVTIANTGNMTDFGDLTAGFRRATSASGPTRVLTAARGDAELSIDYFTIATTGNAADFGDITAAGSNGTACTSAHGGLQ